MQRRRARDPMDSLELGNQLNLSASIPMRRLTKMKVVKYLILILIAIFIHTTYRLLWRTNESVSQNEEVRDQVDEQIEAFKDNSRKLKDPVQDEVNHKGTVKSKFAEKLERYEHFKEAIEEAKKEIHIENVVDTEKVIDLENSENDVKKSEKSVEEVIKENVDDIKGLEQLDVVVDKRREVMELEKEHRIESKIAEILDEIKDPDDVKPTEKVDNNSIRQGFINDRKPPAMPAVDEAFIDKANKIVEKMAPENKIARIKVQQEHHGTPEIVTAATRDHFEAVKQLVYSIQKFYPKEKIYIFDLDLTDQQRRHLMAACNVRMREFWSNLFPKFVSDWEHYHWKPLIIQTALAEFGHIIWINPGQVLSAPRLIEIAQESSDLSIRVFGQSQIHTTFAVTDRSMYKYLPTDRKKIYDSPHMEIFGLILHNTEELNERFLKLLVACAMEPKCMAPATAKWTCDFDFSGKLYADCHRYDESAMNIILKNWFNFDNSIILRNPTTFKVYDPSEKMPLKMCRDENDMIRRHVHRKN